MALAARLPAPMALMTVAAPVATSPPAYTPSKLVLPTSLTQIVPRLGSLCKPVVVLCMIGFGVCPMAMMTVSTSIVNSLPGMVFTPRLPFASGSVSSMQMAFIALTQPQVHAQFLDVVDFVVDYGFG